MRAALPVLVSLAVLIAGWVAYDASQGAKEAETRKQEIHDCREGNIPNAYLQLRAREFVATDKGPPSITTQISHLVLPILSCEESEDLGQPVRLRPDEEAKYLRIFKGTCLYIDPARPKGCKLPRLPLVHDGHVVGAEEFPAPRRRP